MDKHIAEKIVKQYGGTIANSNFGVAKKKSLLPCSRAKIKHAFYVFISLYINEFGKLPKELADNLVSIYSMLDAFIEDNEANRINKIGQKIKSRDLNADDPNDKKEMEEYFQFATSLHNLNLMNEINEYISECYKENEIL